MVRIEDKVTRLAGCEVLMLREDLNHPLVSGNKWWKLKNNLAQARREHHDTLLTFGGAFSNHIYATAAAAKELGFRSIGVIRGEPSATPSPTLRFAEKCGMILHFVSRERYREKHTAAFVDELRRAFGDFFAIPEGGTNHLAVSACAEWAALLRQELQPDYVCLAVGTGGTIAGMSEGFSGRAQVLGFPALKDAAFLEADIKNFAKGSDCKLIYDYHFGGYAKTSPRLLEFMQSFYRRHNVPLDHVYTGKMVYGVFDLLERGFFPRGSKLLLIHTGGLQGSSGAHNPPHPVE